ncbi:hypothetical protein [Pseudomonas sp. Teo4]|uniref:hypothetical protein n=1 Tax=Pseudomonas sp. Teo4 TaxID=3064528 RepID=UPI002ABBD335|nr:hypothetical protein [Pseudomonas sp. Teo4]MDZ3990361.1 hypothetical protein [Pseudomonas sp. Teo4]
MERSPDLLASILHYCVTATSEWRLSLSVAELYNDLSVDKQQEWPAYVIEGHVYLLADAGYLETKGNTSHIVRVTWNGYEYLDGILKKKLIRDNPFLAKC